MEQNPVMVLVGIYGSETDAKADYDDIKRLNSFTTFGELLDEGEVALVVVAEVEREGSLTKEFKRASRMMHRYVGTGAARIREALDGREPEHVTR